MATQKTRKVYKKNYAVMGSTKNYFGIGTSREPVATFRRKGAWMDPFGPLAAKIMQIFGGDSIELIGRSAHE